MFPPVAIGQARLVSADLKLAGGFCLPAGAAALVPHHAMHSASFNWDKPNEFLPGFSLPPTEHSIVSWCCPARGLSSVQHHATQSGAFNWEIPSKVLSGMCIPSACHYIFNVLRYNELDIRT